MPSVLGRRANPLARMPPILPSQRVLQAMYEPTRNLGGREIRPESLMGSKVMRGDGSLRVPLPPPPLLFSEGQGCAAMDSPPEAEGCRGTSVPLEATLLFPPLRSLLHDLLLAPEGDRRSEAPTAVHKGCGVGGHKYNLANGHNARRLGCRVGVRAPVHRRPPDSQGPGAVLCANMEQRGPQRHGQSLEEVI